MNILSADTSTDVLSIALSTDNSYEERLVKGRFSHSEDLLAEIESLLSRAGIGRRFMTPRFTVSSTDIITMLSVT